MTERNKNLILSVCTIVMCLLALEGVLRWFETKDYSLPIRYTGDGYITHKLNLDKLRYDNENEIKVHIKTNAEGFVGENYTIDKSSTTLRIVVFGDSFTEAMQVDYEKSFAVLLRQELMHLLSTTSTNYTNVEVMNFGVGGTGTADAMLFYEHFADKYKPDIVIDAMYLGNDVDDNGRYYRYADTLLGGKHNWHTVHQDGAGEQRSFVVIKDTIYRSSALVRFVDTVVRKNPMLHKLAEKVGIFRPVKKSGDSDTLFSMYYYYLNPRDAVHEQNVNYSAALVNHFRDVVSADGRKFVLLLIPEGMPLHPDLLDNYIKKHPTLSPDNFIPSKLESDIVSKLNSTVNVVSMTKHIVDEIKNREVYLVSGTGHLNESGHEVVAKELASYIYDFAVR